MIIKRLTLVWVLSISFCGAFAQKYNINTYSVNDGLPSSQVYDVHLDDMGLVWFATAYGLVKFDGFEFDTYSEEHGLRDELIYDIFEDSKAQLWVSTEKGGVGIFKGDTVIYHPKLSFTDSMLISYITESPAGDMWFGTDAHGVMIWQDSTYSQLSVETGLPSNQIWDIQFLREGEVWIATMNGVAVYKEGEGIVEKLTEQNGLSGFAAYQVFEASNGTIWIPTSSGITLIDSKNTISTITEINGRKLGYIYNISEDDDGLIWIGTERRGLYWFDGKKYTHITKKNGLSSNYIYRLIKANDGTIWVATDGNGVNIFIDKQFRFYDKDTDINSNSIYSLFIDEDDTIWFGKDDGLGSYTEGVFNSYNIPKELFDEDEIWDIEQLPNGNLLLLTYSYWILEFDGETFKRSALNEPLMEYYINDLYVDNTGEIWIGTERSLIKFNKGDFKEYIPSEEYWKSYINVIYRDREGVFWLGTEGGLARFDGKEFVYYTEEGGITGQSIYEIKEDYKGNIWVGSNKGLAVVEVDGEGRGSQKISTFEMDDIFLSETVSLLFDSEGGLWQGTNAGINYYNVREWYETGLMQKIHYPLQIYGKGLEFNGAAAVMASDGDLWFGTASRGLLQYSFTSAPSTLFSEAPSTYIRKVIANGGTVYDQKNKSADIENIELNHNQNNVEFIFGAVNYKDPSRIFYRYKLDGFDEEWNTGFDKREVVYTNLNPGNYSFSVRAKSTTSEWASEAATISINIKKPLWENWWFIITALLGFIGLIFFYIQTYISFAERRRLKQLVDEKTKDLQSALEEKEILIKEIHHRVKNNMAVVSGLLELQSWQMKEGTARAAIENSRLRIKTMSAIHEKLYSSKNFADINIQEFVADLVSNIEKSLKAGDKKITVEQNVKIEKLDVNRAIPCGLLLNELISNAFEHAFNQRTNGVIQVEFKENLDHYHMIVKDDGIGISKDIMEKTRSSLGLTLIKSLTEQIYGKLSIVNEKGTTVQIIFPKYRP